MRRKNRRKSVGPEKGGEDKENQIKVLGRDIEATGT